MKKKKKQTTLLTIGIVLAAVGILCEAFFLLFVGIVLIIFHIVLKKGKKAASSQQTHDYDTAARFAKEPARPQFATRRNQPIIEYDAETKRSGKRTDAEHRLHRVQTDAFGGAPHTHEEDLLRQARAEIRNLKNIRYARSELNGKTLSDSVIWHSRNGICGSVVQIIRQGNLRYPDLNDRELSERILADDDLMQDLVRSLEWEQRTEIRWS